MTVDVGRDHLLLRVLGDVQRVEEDPVRPRDRGLSWLQADLFLQLAVEPFAGEAEEDQHDAEVHDVAGVAAP